MNESNRESPPLEELAKYGLSLKEYDAMTADEIFDFFGPDLKHDSSLEELAIAAAKASPDFSFDDFCAAVVKSVKDAQRDYQFMMGALAIFPETLEQAYSAYAEALGVSVAELEKEQKQQALLNHILSMGEKEE